MTPLAQALLDECCRQEENCLYTALTFTLWLRWLRRIRALCLITPVAFAALATWQIIVHTRPALGAVCTLLASLIPAVYAASRIEAAIDQYTHAAGDFTNLRDRFRYAAKVTSRKADEVFDAEAKPLFERLEKLRSAALTPPEFCFKSAQKKIQTGDYLHDYDGTTHASP